MKWELFSILLCSLSFTIWNVQTTHQFYYSVPLFFTGACLLFWLTGRLIVHQLPRSFTKSSHFPLCFLVGFFTINTILLLMLYILPWSIKTDLWILCLGIVLLTVSSVRSTRSVENPVDIASKKLSFVALLIIMIAVSFWIQSSVHAVQSSGDTTILKPWADSFFHAGVISSIHNSQGFSSIQHLFLANQPMPFYHFAMYLFPSELCYFTPTNAYQAFNSFLMPFGLVLSGIAAYTLISFVWGYRAGIAAVVGILLIPDASEIGFHNAWLSYHWLQQIAPGGLYGVALVTLAWMFMLHGCKERLLGFVLISYFLTLLCVSYKFQIFFANAFIIWIFPALFFSKLSAKLRIIGSIFSMASYFLAIKLTQQIKEIPFISYDGSASEKYSQFTIDQFGSAWLKKLFTTNITLGDSLLDSTYWYCLMALMLFIGTFGVLGLVYFFQVGVLRRITPLFILLLPMLVICNYLISSLTLAYDSHLVGNPEELIHRPFVWAYYIVCIWVFGAFGYWFEIRLNTFKTSKYIFAVILAILLFVPWGLGRNVQVGPLWGKNFTNTPYPTGLIEALAYVREHSKNNEIIQDSRNDPNLMITALSEKQIFVSLYKPLDSAVQSTRVEELSNVKKMEDSESIVDYFKQNKISWFLAYPDDPLNWPLSMDELLVYQQGGYKVYSFNSNVPINNSVQAKS